MSSPPDSHVGLPPIPPTDLIIRVVPPFPASETENARTMFDEAATVCLEGMERALALLGRELTDFARVLDFGCGPGRMLRHLGRVAESSELHGVDIDAEMIAWCREHIPFATFAVGPHEPPLPYPDGFFDLVFNHSVFTHLDERRQDLWLAELERVLQPGGIALLTIHGTRQWNTALGHLAGAGADPERYRARLERDGILFDPDDHFVGSSHPEWYHSTFHAPWYISEHWTQFFELRAHIHEGSDLQDLIVLERRAPGAERLTPIGHGGGGAAPVVPSSSRERASLVGQKLRRVARALTQSTDDESMSTRSLVNTRFSMYQQGERISIVEAELRAALRELESRLEALEQER